MGNNKAPKGSTPPSQPRGAKSRDRAAARAAARRKAKRTRMIWIGGSVAIVAVLVVATVTSKAVGVTDPLAWDLPALGPTADIQERVTLAEFGGTPTVANFFASWCVECDRELPGFARVSDELRGQVQFVGIASQETGDPMFMPRKHGVDWWPLARDIGGGIGDGLSTALGARGMPLTVFYDGGGEVLHVQLGSITEDQLRGFIDQFYGIA